MAKRILLILLGVLVVIQFIRPEANTKPGPQRAALTNFYPLPAHVDTILKKACYDCHSNNTRYPWYSKVQPVAWWLADHIDEGKHELNFDEFGAYSRRRQAKKMEEVAEQVEKGEMPLKSYAWIHKDARLSAEERATLVAWAHMMQQEAADSSKPDTD